MIKETSLKVALVHDHLGQDGGAERVLRCFQELFPGSPTFTLVYAPKRTNPFFQTQDIRTSFIQRLPFGVRRYQWFFPLMPTAIEQFDFRGYDVVLSSSSAFAKGVITHPNTIHICYCHTPTRFLWTDKNSYIEELRIPKFVKALLPPLLSRLRLWDRLAADRVDVFIANSEVVKERIKKYYKRDATVLHPPVQLGKFEVASKLEDYFLTGGRLVPYKRYDLAIEACNALKLPLKIFGSGPIEADLKKIAGETITFLGRVNDRERTRLYKHARAFLHPQEEDFGITAIEAMASGRPVIAYGKGGAVESVVDAKTGLFFEHQTVEDVISALKRFQTLRFDPVAIRRHAERFDEQHFKERLFDLVHELANHKKQHS